MAHTTWLQWAQQLTAYMEAQTQRIASLEQTVMNLQNEMNTLKQQKQVHIDKIEYNFDQLKVEKLEGTLTIGVSPSTLDSIDDLTVNGASVGKSQSDENGSSADSSQGGPAAGMQQQVSSGIQQYLQQDVHDDMRSLEQKFEFPLDEDYKEMILEDIRKQVETRIEHYIQQYRSGGLKEPLEAATLNIMEKTKNDIRTALETYISGLPRK